MSTVALNLFSDEVMAETEEKIIIANPPPAKKTARASRKKDTEPEPIPEEIPEERQYYSIGSVAASLKVNVSLIRFWTTEFKMKVRTNKKGNRLYTTEQIKQLRMIYHLVKDRGFTLQGARLKLKEDRRLPENAFDLRASLQELRLQLANIRKQLTR